MTRSAAASPNSPEPAPITGNARERRPNSSAQGLPAALLAADPRRTGRARRVLQLGRPPAGARLPPRPVRDRDADELALRLRGGLRGRQDRHRVIPVAYTRAAARRR